MTKNSIKLANQWVKNGDHPEDNTEELIDIGGKPFRSEGKVVRYYRNPDIDGQSKCSHCGDIMHNHGWIDVPGFGYTVCPQDWILKGGDDKFYPCKPYIFQLYIRPHGELFL